ncbi:excalibur calcium-binding domain-containing protein [Sphingomonas sp. LY29]|uniref:excalibur calcium-binding domain-containing protein n=1 Tax=Sphingomonas sp. LY29 TaxID=3095341 RepID=UPI002D779FA4|nr:excalibur calcium-binding domain-containing protein [Sphingomonas sp. LY29]WRP26362.1 excalibur calcium-binding domain-containing protein [Sphingomonas sp. LY29]
MRNNTPFSRDRGQHRKPHRSPNAINRQAILTAVIGVTLLTALGLLTTDKAPSVILSLMTPSDGVGLENAQPADVYYPNCAAARAAGVAPINFGEPGYREKLDVDRDGAACEPHRSW